MKSFLSWGVAGMLALSLTGCILAKRAPALTLLKNSTPVMEIVLPDKPVRSERFAAYELQSHLQKMTGKNWKIVSETKKSGKGQAFFLGATRLARSHGIQSFPSQTYCIKTVPEGLILAGADAPDYGTPYYNMNDLLRNGGYPSFWQPHGTTDAVYDFLENDLGVHWLDATEYGTYIPKYAKDLTVYPDDRTVTPFMNYRGVCHGAGELERHLCLWKEGSPQMNGYLALAYPGLRKQYARPGAFSAARKKMMELFLLRSGNGGENLHCNHSFYGYYDRFWEKNPRNPKVFMKKRPELFAQYPKMNGNQKPSQMCYSSDALLEQIMADARLYFQGKPVPGLSPWHWGKDFFAVVPMDNSTFCQCPKCSAFVKDHTYADLLYHFINRVAKRFQKEFPGKYVSILAYSSYIRPPACALEKNIAVHFCFDASHAPNCTEKHARQLQYLLDWRKKLGEKAPIYMWLYGWGPRLSARYGNYNCFPGSYVRTMDTCFKTFAKCNVRGIFFDGFATGPDGWLMFKLLRDPQKDTVPLLEVYFREMYGKAAEPMLKLYNRMETIYHDPANLKNGSEYTLAFSWGSMGTPERMKELAALLEQAKKSADTAEANQRITLFEKSIWSYMLEGKRLYDEKMSKPMLTLTLPKMPYAGGDPDRIQWNKAVDGGWFYKANSGKRSARPLSIQLAQDGKFLYVQLTDPCKTSMLHNTPAVFAFDTWEILLAKQRGQPFRQYSINSQGDKILLAWWEINMRRYTELPFPPGTRFYTRVSPNLWTVRFAFQLNNMVDKPITRRFYMNVIRNTNPKMAGLKTILGETDSWNSYNGVNNPDRFAEINLKP